MNVCWNVQLVISQFNYQKENALNVMNLVGKLNAQVLI